MLGGWPLTFRRSLEADIKFLPISFIRGRVREVGFRVECLAYTAVDRGQRESQEAQAQKGKRKGGWGEGHRTVVVDERDFVVAHEPTECRQQGGRRRTKSEGSGASRAAYIFMTWRRRSCQFRVSRLQEGANTHPSRCDDEGYSSWRLGGGVCGMPCASRGRV